MKKLLPKISVTSIFIGIYPLIKTEAFSEATLSLYLDVINLLVIYHWIIYPLACQTVSTLKIKIHRETLIEVNEFLFFSNTVSPRIALAVLKPTL